MDCIYIPVWIDLKPFNLSIPVLKPHLHSSMDRFEDWRSETAPWEIRIYIPVWIDLKGEITLATAAQYAIYIPVWIDLKALLTLP